MLVENFKKKHKEDFQKNFYKICWRMLWKIFRRCFWLGGYPDLEESDQSSRRKSYRNTKKNAKLNSRKKSPENFWRNTWSIHWKKILEACQKELLMKSQKNFSRNPSKNFWGEPQNKLLEKITKKSEGVIENHLGRIPLGRNPWENYRTNIWVTLKATLEVNVKVKTQNEFLNEFWFLVELNSCRNFRRLQEKFQESGTLW